MSLSSRRPQYSGNGRPALLQQAPIQVLRAGGGGGQLGQKARLGLQPFANDAGSQFAVIWPALGEAIVDDIYGGSPAAL